MPRYIAHTETWLSHENRMVKPGEEFETVFPKVKVGGEMVEMRLGENISMLVSEAKRRRLVAEEAKPASEEVKPAAEEGQ